MPTPVERILQSSDNGGRGALRFIRMYLKNAIQFPNHPSFSTINPANEQFHNKVGRIDGAVDFLVDCGFERQEDGTLLMRAKSPASIGRSLTKLVDALAEVEAAINQVADAHLYLHIHELKLDRTSNQYLNIRDVLYMQLRCDLVGAPAGKAVEHHRTADHLASQAKWKEKLTLGGTVGVCVHITLYKKRKLLPDVAIAHAMFSFPGGQDDPVMAWVPLTTQAGNRGVQIGSTKVEVDSESLKMLRAEQIDKEAGRQFHQQTKETLRAEGRMPEAPDLVAAGVAEDGYIPHAPEHSEATRTNTSVIPPAFQHGGKNGSGSGDEGSPRAQAADAGDAARAEPAPAGGEEEEEETTTTTGAAAAADTAEDSREAARVDEVKPAPAATPVEDVPEGSQPPVPAAATEEEPTPAAPVAVVPPPAEVAAVESPSAAPARSPAPTHVDPSANLAPPTTDAMSSPGTKTKSRKKRGSMIRSPDTLSQDSSPPASPPKSPTPPPQ